jgi:hypothetical protein
LRGRIESDTNTYPNGNWDSYCKSNSHIHAYTHAYAHRDGNRHTYRDSNANTYTDADRVHWEMLTDAAAAPHPAAAPVTYVSEKETRRCQHRFKHWREIQSHR